MMKDSSFNEKTVERYYDEWTPKYMEDFGQIFQALQTENPEQLIKYIAHTAGLQDQYKILDAGCGIGGASIILAKYYAVQIEALTISSAQVEIAKKTIAATHELKGSINVRKGDFHQLESYYPKNSFDIVLFLEALVHSYSPEKVVQSVRNVLKDNGILYIKDPFRGPSDPNNKGIIDYPIQKINEQFALRIRSLGEILNILSEQGFRIEICQHPKIESTFERGNNFTARHLFQLLPDQKGPWVDEGLTFLHWMEIKAFKRY